MKEINLFQWQQRYLDNYGHLVNSACYFDAGLGKTITALKWMKMKDITNIYVVCQAIKEEDWQEEASWIYKDREIIIVQDEQDLLQTYEEGGKIYILSYHKFHKLRETIKIATSEIIDKVRYDNFDGLIFDEVHKIKSSTQRSRNALMLRKYFKNTIILSGTPFGNKFHDLYNQERMLGSKRTLEEWEEEYTYISKVDMMVAERTAAKNGLNKHMMLASAVRSYKNTDELISKWHKVAYFLDKNDPEVLAILPPFTEKFVQVDTNIRKYNHLKRHRILGDFAAKRVISLLIGLRQVASGFLGDYREETFVQHKSKALKEILQETNNNQIVFYNFNAERDMIMKVVMDSGKKMYLINGTVDDYKLLPREKNTNSVLAIQIQSNGATGINLQKFSNRAIYFSPTYSYTDFSQSKSRIYRTGQKDAVEVIYLVSKDTIEKEIYDVLATKKSYSDQFFAKKHNVDLDE